VADLIVANLADPADQNLMREDDDDVRGCWYDHFCPGNNCAKPNRPKGLQYKLLLTESDDEGCSGCS